VRESYQIPDEVPFGDTGLVPLAAGETLAWRAAV
jgi:dihydroorotase